MPVGISLAAPPPHIATLPATDLELSHTSYFLPCEHANDVNAAYIVGPNGVDRSGVERLPLRSVAILVAQPTMERCGWYVVLVLPFLPFPHISSPSPLFVSISLSMLSSDTFAFFASFTRLFSQIRRRSPALVTGITGAKDVGLYTLSFGIIGLIPRSRLTMPSRS